MDVFFSYDPTRDAQNILRGLRSVNNPRPSRIEALYLARFPGRPDASTAKRFIKEYIQKRELNIDAALSGIVTRWQQVSPIVIPRIEEVFRCHYPHRHVDAYLTIDTRCTYNVQENYFFLSIQGLDTNLTVMHELFHLYTWHAFRQFDLERRFLGDHFNAVKEALTVLLNVEFQDLLHGAVDRGYPQHAALRMLISNSWNESNDLYAILRDPKLKRLLADADRSQR